MSQTNSGAQDLTDIKRWDELLDEYERQVGLPKYTEFGGNETMIESYLSLNRNQIEALNAEDCAAISYELEAYAFFIQRSINRQSSRINWAKDTARKIVIDKINQYKGSFSQQEIAAIKDNDAANTLYKIAMHAQGRVDRLYYLSKGISSLAERLTNIQFLKRKSNGN